MRHHVIRGLYGIPPTAPESVRIARQHPTRPIPHAVPLVPQRHLGLPERVGLAQAVLPEFGVEELLRSWRSRPSSSTPARALLGHEDLFMTVIKNAIAIQINQLG